LNLKYKDEISTILLFAILISAVFLSLNYFSAWNVWGVQSYCILFPDLHVLLCSIDAHFAGFNAFSENPFCEWNIPHVYSRLWFYFHYIGFSDSNRIIIGISILSIFIGATGKILSKNKICGLFFILSPAFLLAIERCNNDLIIFTLLLFPTFKIQDTKLLPTISTHLFLILVVSLKYYPIACALIFFFRNEKLRLRLLHVSIQCTFFIIWMIHVKSDLISQMNFIPNPGYAWSFGFELLNSLTSNLLNIESQISYILLGILTIAYMCRACLKMHNLLFFEEFIKIKQIYIDMFIVGSSILCFCYFVKTSFDHRMIYFIFCIPLLLTIYKNLKFRIPFYINPIFIVISFIVSSWCEFFREWFVYLLENLNLNQHIPISLFFFRSFEIFTNHLLFTTLFALLVSLFFIQIRNRPNH
jgi:hypothetical protein